MRRESKARDSTIPVPCDSADLTPKLSGAPQHLGWQFIHGASAQTHVRSDTVIRRVPNVGQVRARHHQCIARSNHPNHPHPWAGSQTTTGFHARCAHNIHLEFQSRRSVCRSVLGTSQLRPIQHLLEPSNSSTERYREQSDEALPQPQPRKCTRPRSRQRGDGLHASWRSNAKVERRAAT